jgi:hypothetical protein
MCFSLCSWNAAAEPMPAPWGKREKKTKITDHVLIELAIGALNARLYRIH